jgi:antirestriction protein
MKTYEERKESGEFTEEEIETLDQLIEQQGEIILAYFDEVGCSVDELEDQFHDSVSGQYDSWEDFAENVLNDCGDLESVPQWIRNHIDFKSIGRELQHDYFELDGYYFRHI